MPVLQQSARGSRLGLRRAAWWLALAVGLGGADDVRAGWLFGRGTVTNASPPLVLAVGDPLAAENACPCVQGFAQRHYRALADVIAREAGRPVNLVFCQTLPGAAERVGRMPELFVGKAADAGAARCLAMLTDTAGNTTLQGLFVVRRDDATRALPDLASRRILFGPPATPEKHGAALTVLRAFGLALDPALPTADSCNAAALAVARGEADAAVISAYAWPLLSGCGVVERGALRIVGRTDPVPFIGVFAVGRLDAVDEAAVRRALARVGRSARLKAQLESRDGFVPPPVAPETAGAAGWTDWRGSLARDAFSPAVPAHLPAQAVFVWRRPLCAQGLGGVAATGRFVIVSDKNERGDEDAWRCLRADTGEPVWAVSYPAAGKMDFTTVPRATPVIAGSVVYLLGAFGDLLCADLETGRVRWRLNLVRRFGGAVPTWGFCGTPLLADRRLIVPSGSRRAGLVALDSDTGYERWRSPGSLPAYGNLICASFGGRRQIVGCDADSLGGWDPETGRRLWRLVPPEANEFHVPTPLKVGDLLLVASEHNGTRLYSFDDGGVIRPEPWAATKVLAPDICSPVLADGVVWGADAAGMHALGVASGLRPLWSAPESAYADCLSLIAGPAGVLAVAKAGTVHRFAARPPGAVQTRTVFQAVGGFDPEVWSYPALVGRRLYLRSANEAVCLDLGDGAPAS